MFHPEYYLISIDVSTEECLAIEDKRNNTKILQLMLKRSSIDVDWTVDHL